MRQVLYPPLKEPTPSPRLATLHAVARILKDLVEKDLGPVPLAEIARRLPAKRVRHGTIRACVEELKLLGFVTEGSKGVLWTLAEPATLRSTAFKPL